MSQQTARLVTVAEAVEYSGLSERTIRRWIADGVLPAYRVPYRIRVDLDDLDRLIRPVAADGEAS